MRRHAFMLSVLFSLFLAALPPVALAGDPDSPGVEESAALVTGDPDVPQSDESARQADNGELVLRCGTDERGPKIHISKKHLDALKAANRLTAGGQIPVYFHVIYTNTEGNVSDAALDAQVLVMNRNFAGRDYNGNIVSGAANTGYTFVKVGTSRTNSRKWFGMTPGSSREVQAKNALAVSPGNTLNIYTCKPGQNLLGWAVFPWTSQAGTNQDGVVIHYGSLPGGYLSPYNLGGTATHEVGHYLGLYHTFQGGCHSDATCSTAGDLVCDTPGQGTSTSGCPNGKDTCSGAGLDPIHNYMDYSTDICYTNFTGGQDTRMNGIVNTYRSWIGSVRVANGAGGQGAREADQGLAAFRAKPNPFNPRTKIEFGLRQAGRASVRIYDIRGRLAATVVDRNLPAGNHSFDFDGSKLASGVYRMEFRAQGQRLARNFTLLK